MFPFRLLFYKALTRISPNANLLCTCLGLVHWTSSKHFLGGKDSGLKWSLTWVLDVFCLENIVVGNHVDGSIVLKRIEVNTPLARRKWSVGWSLGHGHPTSGCGLEWRHREELSGNHCEYAFMWLGENVEFWGVRWRGNMSIYIFFSPMIPLPRIPQDRTFTCAIESPLLAYLHTEWFIMDLPADWRG